MTKATEKKAMDAAAELHRLAEAAARFRVYREREGHEATSPLALAVWMQRRQWKPIEPTPADHDEARRERPDLALLADGSNPSLSGANQPTRAPKAAE